MKTDNTVDDTRYERYNIFFSFPTVHNAWAMFMHDLKRTTFLEVMPQVTFQQAHLHLSKMGFTSDSTARVMLGQVLSIVICGGRILKE